MCLNLRNNVGSVLFGLTIAMVALVTVTAIAKSLVQSQAMDVNLGENTYKKAWYGFADLHFSTHHLCESTNILTSLPKVSSCPSCTKSRPKLLKTFEGEVLFYDKGTDVQRIWKLEPSIASFELVQGSDLRINSQGVRRVVAYIRSKIRKSSGTAYKTNSYLFLELDTAGNAVSCYATWSPRSTCIDVGKRFDSARPFGQECV